MKNTQPKHKTLSQTQTQTTESITEVHLLDSPRKSVSFKCNEKLWKTFVSQIRAQGLSVCHVLEPMIFGWLEAKVHLSNTIKPLRIKNLVVERAVRRVRRYGVESEGLVEVGGVCVVCGGVAYAVGTRVGGVRVRLCRRHFEGEKSRLLSWRVLGEG